MKKIFKLGFVLFVLLFSLNAAAQESGFTFGIKAGVNLSNTSLDIDPLKKRAKVGFRVGATVDYAVTNEFFLESGLYLTTKGGKGEGEISTDNISFDGDVHINQTYLQIPLTAAYKIEIAPEARIFFNFGPFMAYGIGGKSKLKGKIEIPIAEVDGNMENDTFGDDILKRFDFGLTAGIGVEYGPIVFGTGYELGLANIAADGLKTFEGLGIIKTNSEYKTRNAYISIGYRFR